MGVPIDSRRYWFGEGGDQGWGGGRGGTVYIDNIFVSAQPDQKPQQ